MRKILTKIATLILIVTMSVTTLTACGLVTTDTDRDMAQTVATVKISDAIEAEDILKSEMLSAFMSYGYLYVQSYGYTVEATYELILKNLVQNKIIIQGSREALAEAYNSQEANVTEFIQYFKDNALANGTAINPASASAENLEKYLTAYEVAQAKYNVRKSINQMIDSYEESEEDEDEKEDEKFEARATHTHKHEEAEYEYELKTQTPEEYDYKVAAVVLDTTVEAVTAEYSNVYDLNMAIYGAYEIDLSTTERVKAINKAIKDLKNSGLIKSDESQNIKTNPENILEYSYFKNSIKSQYESLIVTKYEDSLVTTVEGRLSDAAVYDQYRAEYNAQKENYLNNVAGYESALDAVTEDTFVVCNPYAGYGYVLNLLIGFSNEQSAKLSAEKSRKGATEESIANVRNELLAELIVKDQRETWVYSSYGEYAEGEFAFDKEYFVSEDEAVYNKLGKFIGKVYGAKSTEDENEDGVLENTWTFENVIPTTIGFNAFLTDYVDALLGTTVQPNVIGSLDLTEAKRAAFDDLIYAFSTDSGSLGSYLGYAYSPFNSATTYVKEFAEAAKEVVDMGAGAYKLIATDYGYHLILCTKKISKGADEYTDLASFVAALSDEDSLAYKYREVKYDSIVSTEVGKIANTLINSKYEEDGVVTFNNKAFKDLIPNGMKVSEDAE